MRLKPIAFIRPEGCVANLDEQTIRVPGGFWSNDQITTRVAIDCGSRNRDIETSTDIGMYGPNSSGVDKDREVLGRRITDKLAAMCLGCEHNCADDAEAALDEIE